MRAPLLITTMVLLAGAAGCMPTPSNQSAPPAPVVVLTPEAEAQQIFAGRCSVCHGAQGAGDGAGAAALNPRPRNFHDPAWQSGVTDAQIENIIRVGGAAVGKSPLMAANPDLVAKPAVVAALRTMIRGFR